MNVWYQKTEGIAMLDETVTAMKQCLAEMEKDLAKAMKGNRTAAQRVRTSSLSFSKLAKEYRRLSLLAEKKGRS